MRISIFGLGYVGAVSCGCFAKEGHEVIGVDVSREKIDLINSGKSPIVEDQLDDYILEGINNGRIKAVQDIEYAIKNSELSIICVGTPSQDNGNIDLSYIFKVCAEIADCLRSKNEFHTIAIRSTVIPGTIHECARIIERLSGKTHLQHFGVASNPEFLREGTAIKDFYNPAYTIIGTNSEKSEEQLRALYASIDCPIYVLKPEESEMIKYVNNNFHALKISFANEIGNICKELGVDSHQVMDIVCKDTKLNLSPYYMKPGFAFGGSCLPKDVRGLKYRAKLLDIPTPLLNSLLESNNNQIERGLKLIYATKKKKIGILGFAFKAGTDDLRESPMVDLIETLIGKGFELFLYDSNVILSNLMGKNKDYVDAHIPHLSKLLKNSCSEVIDASEVVVIGNKSDEFANMLHQIPSSKTIIDFVRIKKSNVTADNYVGICW